MTSPLAIDLQLSYYPSARQVTRRQFDDHTVANQQADEIPLPPAPDVRRDSCPLNLHLIEAAR